MTDHLHPIDRVEDITPARLRHYAAILTEQGRESPARVVWLCADYLERLIPYLTNRGICPMCGSDGYGVASCIDCGWKS